MATASKVPQLTQLVAGRRPRVWRDFRREALFATTLATAIGMGALVIACSSGSVGSTEAGAPSSSSSSGGTPCFGCSDAAVDVSQIARVTATLDQTCGSVDGCHGAAAGSFGIHAGSEFSDLINVTSSEDPSMKRVLPGDPEQSYLYLKVSCAPGIVGGCMPPGAPVPDTANLFREWIEAGAPTM